MTSSTNPDPSEVNETVKLFMANNGLGYGQVIRLAQICGLRVVPPQSISIAGVAQLLQRHGPLWVHGTAHIVVFAGVDEQQDKIFVHDPWPPNVGLREWRSYSSWFIKGKDAGSQGVSDGVQASFLYHP